MSRGKKLLLTAGAVIVVVGLLVAGGAYLVVKQRAVAYSPPSSSQTANADGLQAFGTSRVFFGHQSVGDNMLKGLTALYQSSAAKPPTVEKVTSPGDVKDSGAGQLIHAYIGKNGSPGSKIDAFDTMMRSGMAQHVDVALMKLCYVDFGRRTDPREVFTHYQKTMAGLERDFPQVSFVYTTAPLKVSDDWGNNIRTQFNSLVRTELKGKRLLDIAEIESRAPDGSRSTGELLGFSYEALQPNYASDGAHLNTEGAKRVAAGLVAAVNASR